VSAYWCSLGINSLKEIKRRNVKNSENTKQKTNIQRKQFATVNPTQMVGNVAPGVFFNSFLQNVK